ncbi:MAG: acetoacetate--CoA ligase [Candidatus Limnocylindria bacterium]
MRSPPTPEILWQPSADARERSRIGDYMTWLERTRQLAFGTYDDLWRWSVDDLEGFWLSIWEYFGVGPRPSGAVLTTRVMPGAAWFPGARLNYAEHVLRLGGRAPRDEVVVERSQTRGPRAMTGAQLIDQVARARAGLERLGVGRDDRVAAYLPNTSEAVIGMLATASLGTIWSSCAPEFGTPAVIDRFGQIEPSVLIAVDGYRYGDRTVERADEVAAIRAALPSLRATVVVPYLRADRSEMADTMTWDELTAQPAELTFEPVAFDHPLFILYSSGTTGLPKPIVHGHGGILLEHLKIHALHYDRGPADRFFWFTTTGWMMWNYLVSGLAVGSTIVLYDGSPGHPDLSQLWRMAAEAGITYFGTSAPFLMACRKSDLRPGRELDLSPVRAIGSTGAPLPAEGFRWVYEAIDRDLQLQSVSGGTDVCTAFVGGSPLVPVWEGEISCRHLGCRVEAFDEAGRSVIGQQGDLVLTAPLPSMPVGLWNDSDGSRYRDTYFSDYPGAWRHGDWITITDRATCIISGRSDATLNRAGVRIGTAEFYSVVEAMPEVADALVVHLEDTDRLLLFVALADGTQLTTELRDRIVAALRDGLSPRHVPDEIRAVPAVPRTLSGKKLEVPVKRILSGTPVERAASRDSLANPEALDAFAEIASARDAS